jgi:hypothetical protein
MASLNLSRIQLRVNINFQHGTGGEFDHSLCKFAVLALQIRQLCHVGDTVISFHVHCSNSQNGNRASELIAARREKRKFNGSEVNEKYRQLSRQYRLNEISSVVT